MLAAYGDCSGLTHALPGAVSQAFLSLADTAERSLDASGWVDRIDAATNLLD
ncbi:MAG: hypothetical protein ACRDP8_25320 [Actinopolymorphaceae bacterium]